MTAGRFRSPVRLVCAALGLCVAVALGVPVSAGASPAPSLAAQTATAQTAATTSINRPDVASAAGAGGYVALTPTRLLDTRIGVGGTTGPVAARGTVHLTVSGRGGVPSAGVGAVVLTVTETAATHVGHITVYADGTALPTASNLNFVGGQTVANLVVTTVGKNGDVALDNASTGSVQLIADVSGYYVSGAPHVPGAFGSVATKRLLDTRIGLGAPQGAVAAGSVTNLSVAGTAGVPSGAGAVILTVTVTSPTRNGYVTVFKNATKRPTSSNVNFAAGQTVANLVVARVGVNNQVSIYNGSSGSAQLIVDISGYFVASAPTATGTLGLLAPTRLLDTRVGTGAAKAPVGAGATVDLAVAGHGSIPSSAVAAVVLTVTVTSPTATGHLTVYGDGTVRPGVSNLNYTAGKTIANTVIVPVGADGDVALYNSSSGTTALIADVSGYVLRGDPAWQAPQLVDPTEGGFSSVSCPTTDFCLAGGTGGVVYTYSSGSWSGPTALGGVGDVATDLSCVSSTFCAGALEPGNGADQPLTLIGKTWKIGAVVSGGIKSISCVSSSFCLALTGTGFMKFDGSAWSTPTVLSGLGSAVSCASTTLCVSIRKNAYLTFNGTDWSAPTSIDTGQQMSAISCPTTTFCAAVDDSGQYLTYDGTTWTTPAPTGAGSSSTYSLSCASPTSCAAVNAAGVAVQFDGTQWTAPTVIDANTFAAVSCPADGTCTGVDGAGGVLTLAAGTWSSVTEVDPPLGFPTAVSCATTTFCVAVDANGGYFRYTSTGWQQARQISATATAKSAVSCPSTTFCMAVGGGAQTTSFNGTTWSSPISVGADLTSVSCTSSTFCMAVDAVSGSVYRFDGTTWTTSSSPVDTEALNVVSCVSAAFCVAVDNGGQEVTFTGTWSAPSAVSTSDDNPQLVALSCATTTFCMASDSNGSVYQYDGSSWALSTAGLGYRVSLSCTLDGKCVGIGTTSTVSFDGHSWGQPVGVPSTVTLASVSCLPGFCVAVDSNGHGLIGQ